MSNRTLSKSPFYFLILLLTVIGAVGAIASGQAFASKYTPEGIYEPVIYRLENGMRVILNPRPGARNVAIRLDVGIGNYDFTCEKMETAHFLEHLLFTGTSQHTETELDELITQHGGDWNAYTYDENTDYEINIFSEYTDLALDTLREIITSSEITPEYFETAQTIIYRELGGKPSEIRQFLYQHEIVSTATRKSQKVLFKGNRSYCSNMDTLKQITYQNIIDAYERFYVPGNMTLVVVGDFDTVKIKNKIQQTFGPLMTKKLVRDIPRARDFKDGPVYFSSSFKPIVGENSKTGLLYRTNGYDSPDYYVLTVIQSYLQNRLYENIRVEEGLTYAPYSELIGSSKSGTLLLSAETTTNHIDHVTKLMLKEVALLREGGVSDEKISETIRSLLLNGARGIESNSSIADYYTNYLYEVESYGKFVDQEDYLEKITTQDVREVVERYLIDSNMAFLEAKPTFTYNQLYLLLFLTIISILLLIWRLLKRMHFHISGIQKTSGKSGDTRHDS